MAPTAVESGGRVATLGAASSRGAVARIPLLRPLYDYAWFVGFFAAGGLYVLLMKAACEPLEPPTRRLTGAASCFSRAHRVNSARLGHPLLFTFKENLLSASPRTARTAWPRCSRPTPPRSPG